MYNKYINIWEGVLLCAMPLCLKKLANRGRLPKTPTFPEDDNPPLNDNEQLNNSPPEPTEKIQFASGAMQSSSALASSPSPMNNGQIGHGLLTISECNEEATGSEKSIYHEYNEHADTCRLCDNDNEDIGIPGIGEKGAVDDKDEAEASKQLDQNSLPQTKLLDDQKDKCAQKLQDWYMKRMHNHTSEECLKGFLESHLIKLSAKFSECAHLMYETHQLSVFRWTVNPITAKAIQWGGNELFEGMHNANASDLKDDLLPLEKQQFIDSYSDDKTWLCTVFKNILLMKLKEVCPDSSVKQLQWNAGFVDMCTDCKIMAWKKEQKDSSDQTMPLYQENSDVSDDSNNNEEGDSDNGGDKEVVQFEPWDDEQKAFSLKDQGHIPIVRAAWEANEEVGKPLCLIHQSKEYQVRLATCAVIEDDKEPEPVRTNKKRK
ncbi:hypothetical protein GYMLUDRAFT_252925 [Collybiopsis luxurians FD-317 M1]|uniref:Uncharacterized protein n=1 Tax=Collybiopsis luxurians FD-317 M1 TaxID=944289 RepID=A0A0D0C728_9AGAR|nr:hypothetical protein GYMLUDRAFT_252925 [Collybiopsis luxurians FD-317 M1]